MGKWAIKITITIVLMVGMLWASAAWGQYGSGKSESMTDRWAQENAMSRQRYEKEDAEQRMRQAEAERDRMKSQRDDMERQRNDERRSPYPRRATNLSTKSIGNRHRASLSF